MFTARASALNHALRLGSGHVPLEDGKISEGTLDAAMHPSEASGTWRARRDLNPLPSVAATPMSSGLMGPQAEFDVAAPSSEGLAPPIPPLTTWGSTSPAPPPRVGVQSTITRQ